MYQTTMRSSLLLLSSIVSSMGYFIPLCHYDYLGQYVCFPQPPPQSYYNTIRSFDQTYQGAVNSNVEQVQQWQQNVLKHQVDYTNHFPWLASNPFIEHQQTLQKEWLDYYQGFQRGVIDREFENHENRLNHQEAISNQQRESLSG